MNPNYESRISGHKFKRGDKQPEDYRCHVTEGCSVEVTEVGVGAEKCDRSSRSRLAQSQFVAEEGCKPETGPTPESDDIYVNCD